MNMQNYEPIFRPIYYKRLKKLDLNQMNFAYYTSAMTGLNILRSRLLWMRAAACMNDYREIEYGIQLLNQAVYSSDMRRQRIRSIASELGLGESMLENFLRELNHNKQRFITHTYLACVSEHDPERNAHGRLSMWRAYGRKTGVAFVLSPAAILYPANSLPLQISPVAYETQTEFDRSFDWMLWNIERHLKQLRQCDPSILLDHFTHMLLLSLFSVKHPGFQEEQEWRIIYQEHGPSTLDYDLVSVDGIPQIIYKLPLYGPKDESSYGLPVREALKRIIIGPTQYADVIRAAFIKVLEEMGIEDPERRVFTSNIPLR